MRIYVAKILGERRVFIVSLANGCKTQRRRPYIMTNTNTKPELNLNLDTASATDSFLADIANNSNEPADTEYVSAINVFVTSTTLGQGCAGAFDLNKGESIDKMIIEPAQNYKVQPVKYRRIINAEKLKTLAMSGDNTKASNYLLALDRESERVACLNLFVRELEFVLENDSCNSVVIFYVNKCLFNELTYGKHKFYINGRNDLTDDSYYGDLEIKLWERAHDLMNKLNDRLVFRQFENLKADKDAGDSLATAMRKSIYTAMHNKLVQAYREESAKRKAQGQSVVETAPENTLAGIF